MRVSRTFPLLVLLLGLCGCGTGKYLSEMMGDVDNAIPPTPLTAIAETSRVTRYWSTDVGSGTNELYIKLIPAFVDERAFVADSDGVVVGLDAKSGKRLWKKDIDLPITGGPGADFSMVLLGTSEGDVVSLIPDNGEELWRAKVSSEILSSPRENDNVVIIRTIDGKLFALEATTGERLWVYDRTVPALTLRGTSTPVIAGDIVIAGFDGGRVTALDRDNGKLIWETRVAIARGRSELERMVDIDAQPLVYDDIIYIATYQSNIAALTLQTGAILWQREISAYTELGVDENYLYVSDDEGNVWALDKETGISVWKQEQLLHRKPTGPSVIGDKVVVGDLEGYLHWMDKQSGEFVARTRVTESPILVKPTVVNDKLYVYASDGTLASFGYTDLDTITAESEADTAKATAQPGKDAEYDEELDDVTPLGKIFNLFGGGDEAEAATDTKQRVEEEELDEVQLDENPADEGTDKERQYGDDEFDDVTPLGDVFNLHGGSN